MRWIVAAALCLALAQGLPSPVHGQGANGAPKGPGAAQGEPAAGQEKPFNVVPPNDQPAQAGEQRGQAAEATSGETGGEQAPAQNQTEEPAPKPEAPEAESAPAPQTPPPKRAGPKARVRTSGHLIEMNFKNVDIVNFLSIMSETLGVPMVWNESQIRGNITLVSPKKFSRKDALRIFETVLSMQGYTTIRTKGSPVVQVVPTKEAPRFPSPTRTDAEKVQESNFFVTQIIPLRYADANQIKAALTPLISRTAGLAVYAPANVLVLSDSESNVNRLVSIIKEMDVPPEDVQFAVVTLKYASARKLAPILTSLSSILPTGARRVPGRPPVRGRAAQQGLKVVADERTNTLILVGEPVSLGKFKEIIDQLDVPGKMEEQAVKVYRLEYADAEELVKILKDIRLQPQTKPGEAPKAQPAAGGSSLLPQLTLTADKATNSLIVFGPTDLIATMGQMVAQLDVRRPQVYVEVLIMEVSLDKSLQLGVRWQATSKVDNGVAGAGVPTAAPQTLENALAGGQSSAIGIVGNEITFAGQKFTSFSAFIQATQQDQDLNVLANPQLLTLNNQEAQINVSQVVPVSTRTVTNIQNQTTTEYEFKDVGIILKITPQITGKDKVRLLIDQESSSIAAKQDVATATQQAVTTLKRKINTQVVVDNNTTMAIGGLIQNQEVKTDTKIPCLGDIPLLGWLFKSTAEELRKTNLIVFIRPRIVLSPEDMMQATGRVQRRYDELRNPKANADKTLRESFGLPAAGAGGKSPQGEQSK